MADLHIQLLGQFQVRLDGETASNFVSDKARALLAYLAVENHHPHRRETLAYLLWPDKEESRARANLRRVLTNLRQVLRESKTNPTILITTHHDVKFNPPKNTWLDVEILSQIHEFSFINKNIDNCHQALEIYHGEFLAGFNLPDSLPFDEWVLMKREQYSRKMVGILEKASEYHENRGDFESAMPFSWRHVELEPWHEKARCQLMRLLYYSGRRDAALQQFIDLKNELKSVLNISPGKKVRQLYESMLADQDDGLGVPQFLLEKRNIDPLVPETFVARNQQLKCLHSNLDSMILGKGNITLVAGDAGSGKTLLVQEFIRQAQSRYPNLVAAVGSSNAFTGVGDPYLPFREILNQLSGDIQTFWKAGSFSRQYATNLWRTIPITCQALLTYGQDLIDTVISGYVLSQNTKHYAKKQPAWYKNLNDLLQYKKKYPNNTVQQANLISQLTTVFHNISEQAPLLLFLDDLHWADIGTIGMLFQFCKEIKQSRIMLIGAYRSEEVNSILDEEQHPLRPILNEIQRNFGDVLINLDTSSGIEFIHDLISSEPNELDTDFQKQLYLLTNGHALFTVELLRCLQESDVLAKNDHGVWELRSEIHLELLPPQTEAVIAQRIGRLDPNLKRILTLAAIEGEIFTAEIIAALENLPVTQVVSSLSNQLDKQHRLIQPLQIRWEGDQSISTYRFRHILFQKYLYDGLDEIQKRSLHHRVGTEMEKIISEDKTQYAFYLAKHFHLANQPQQAFGYYTLAGERAIHMSAYPEAINHYESALQMLLKTPENQVRNEKELNLQLQLGLAYQAIMGFANDKVGSTFQRAWELCQDGKDLIKRITAIQLLISYYANIADFKTAKAMLDLLEKSYEELEEVVPEYLIQLHLGYGYLDSIFGKHQSVSARFEEALKYYDHEKMQTTVDRVGLDIGIYCHGWAGLHQNWLGYPDKAKEHIYEALKIAESHHSKLFTTDALWLSTWISLEMEDIPAAREYSEALMELTTREHYFLFEAVARVFKGRILSHDGKHEEAISCIEKGLEMFYQTGMVTTQILYLHALIEAYYNAGKINKGLEIVYKAEKAQQETGETRLKSLILKVKGDLLLLNRNETAAEEAYLKAISVAQEESARLLELEASKRLAHLWHQQGRTRQAKDILQPVYDWFTEGFNTPMLKEAKKLLKELVI